MLGWAAYGFGELVECCKQSFARVESFVPLGVPKSVATTPISAAFVECNRVRFDDPARAGAVDAPAVVLHVVTNVDSA